MHHSDSLPLSRCIQIALIIAVSVLTVLLAGSRDHDRIPEVITVPETISKAVPLNHLECQKLFTRQIRVFSELPASSQSLCQSHQRLTWCLEPWHQAHKLAEVAEATKTFCFLLVCGDSNSFSSQKTVRTVLLMIVGCSEAELLIVTHTPPVYTSHRSVSYLGISLAARPCPHSIPGTEAAATSLTLNIESQGTKYTEGFIPTNTDVGQGVGWILTWNQLFAFSSALLSWAGSLDPGTSLLVVHQHSWSNWMWIHPCSQVHGWITGKLLYKVYAQS